jgi:hypothetical protein
MKMKYPGLKPSKNGGKMNTVNPQQMSASQQASGLESYGDGSADDLDYSGHRTRAGRGMKKKGKKKKY